MKKFRIENMTRGWFIGNFLPRAFKAEDFEVGLLTHKKGEHWAKHYHAVSTEINLLISGSMNILGEEIKEGDIFVIEPYEIADPVFLEDCLLVCVKVPSIPGDKYEVI